MATRTVLHIPRPCQQSWAGMAPTEAGRHCAACEKTVVDFSQMSDAQLAAFFAAPATGRVCGRFRPGQLGRTLHLQPPQAPRWTTWLALSAAALSGCAAPDPAVSPPDDRSLVVRGQILSQLTRQPLAHSLVVCEDDTSIHTLAAPDGTFTINLPAHLRESQLFAGVDRRYIQANAEYEPQSFQPQPYAIIKLEPIALTRAGTGQAIDTAMVMGIIDYSRREVMSFFRTLPKLPTIKFIPPVTPSSKP